MFTKINQVNALLQSQGRSVVQQRQVENQVMYGYKPQCVIDVVNEVFGPEHWYYKLLDTELFTLAGRGQPGLVVASVKLFIRTDSRGEFINHGIQFGQSQIVNGNVGDAKKGAVTDGLGKSFASFSIGRAAYRGELGAIFNSPQVPSEQPLRAVPPPADKAKRSGLPELPNVHYETTDKGLILAIGETYNSRFILKSIGFVWMPKEKAWGLGLQQAA